ncbi:MAG: glycosyltransferase family 2 protein [Ruminococcus sp.]|nr:glycosyltransferase family 2 protein [Ruminococcus sp.]
MNEKLINELTVSVIVPVYNAQETICLCVDSILHQDYTDYELILIDDGSSDKSAEICDNYSDKNKKVVVYHTDNNGVSAARNLGIEKAKGKYILFVDSDDYVTENYIRRLIEIKEQKTDTDNIWCGFRTFRNSNKDVFIEKYVYDKNTELSLIDYKKIMTLHEKWLDAGPYCKLYDRNVINRNNIRFPVDLSLGEDLIFNFRYLDCTNGKICVLNEDNYNYYLNDGNSLGTKYYSQLFDIYKTINATMRDYVKKWGCDELEVQKFYNACFFKYEVCLKNTFNKKNKNPRNEKYRQNNEILNSSEFSEAFSKMSYKPNLLLRAAYKTKKYEFVQLSDKIISLLATIKKKL